MLRIATYHTELSRKGPGLLLRDILRGGDAQVEAVARVIAAADADILLLQGVDYDAELRTLSALAEVLAEAGVAYPHLFALRPNRGLQTGLDLDGDGRRGEPEDAQGYGWYQGEGGMALLSRYPVEAAGVRDFTAMPWRDMPGALLPEAVADAQGLRLSTTGHWVVPVEVGGTRLTLLAFHATPPVFDDENDLNGRRNHDEIAFWRHYLDGAFGPPPEGRFVLLGVANLDPVDGEGRKEAIAALLADPRLRDPAPRRAGPVAERHGHAGAAVLDTADWAGPVPGALRVSYLLPSADLSVTASGVLWPSEGAPLAEVVDAASRHRLIWVDLALE
ncbi:MAG: endonuclease/exonuclease/phosphatase family protein [Roseovarius sp.]